MLKGAYCQEDLDADLTNDTPYLPAGANKS